MEEESIRNEVLNNIKFGDIAQYIASKGNFADLEEERAHAGMCLDLAIEHSVDGNNYNEFELGNYRAVCVRNGKEIIELSLNYSENIAGYKYCE